MGDVLLETAAGSDDRGRRDAELNRRLEMVPIVAVESRVKSAEVTSPKKVVPPRLPAARPTIGPPAHNCNSDSEWQQVRPQ